MVVPVIPRYGVLVASGRLAHCMVLFTEVLDYLSINAIGFTSNVGSGIALPSS